MQMTPPSSKLLPLLQEISSYLLQLLNALNKEHQSLSNGDIQSIESIAREKIILMEHLEDLNKERRILLEAAGLDLSSSGIEDFFLNNNSPRAPQMKTCWTEISNLTNQCEKQNNINGIIIENNRRHSENALSILQGKQQGTEYYSNKGAPIKTSKNQTLIRA